jgi:N-acetylglucosaminyl-diphospho-decaprenol L-rhamnosyltransferase
MMPASVVVPTLGGARLARVLDSLAAQTVGHQTLVVDDGTGDPAIAELVARHEDTELLALERNSGFSRACNLAAGQAAGDALVLLNDDCVVEPGFL